MSLKLVEENSTIDNSGCAAVGIRQKLMEANLQNNLWYVPTIDIKYATSAAKQFSGREIKRLIKEAN